MSTVTMFKPPNYCASCNATELGLKRHGITYDVVVVDDPEGLKAEGFAEFPVVKVDCGEAAWSWSGYRHDDIRRLADLFTKV